MHIRVRVFSQQSGNRMGTRNPKWGKNGNKVGTKLEQEPQSGAKMETKWEQSGNKNFKVGQEREQSGNKVGTRTPSGARMGTKCKQSRTKNHKVGQEWEQMQKGLRTCFILLDKGLRSQLIHATDYTRYMYKGTPIMHIRVRVFSQQSGNRMGTRNPKWGKNGNKVGTNGNKVGPRIQKRAQERNKVGTKLEQEPQKGARMGTKWPEVGQEWEAKWEPQSGARTEAKWEQSRNKNPKVGQEREQSGKVETRTPSGARMGTKWKQSRTKNHKVGQEWEQNGKRMGLPGRLRGGREELGGANAQSQFNLVTLCSSVFFRRRSKITAKRRKPREDARSGQMCKTY